jgi:hypothetical protein
MIPRPADIKRLNVDEAKPIEIEPGMSRSLLKMVKRSLRR